MNLTGLLSISGKPGLYRMVGNRKSGLVVEPIAGGRQEFVPQRLHQFTPLESIAIFTDDGDSVPLREVLAMMREQEGDNAPPSPKASKDVLREYLLDVLPNHDRDRVYPSDIKKLVKWYGALKASGVLEAEEGAAEVSATTPEASATTPEGADDAVAAGASAEEE